MGSTLLILALAACTATPPVETGTSDDTGPPSDTADSGDTDVRLSCAMNDDPTDGQTWKFVEIGEAAGARIEHGFSASETLSEAKRFSAGVAAGDIDGDCDLDLYLTTGSTRAEALLVNDGTASFTDEGEARGVDRFFISSGPAFLDFDGDGALDLLVGAVDGGVSELYLNDGAGGFAVKTGAMGLSGGQLDTFGVGAGDIDGDGDLDIAVGRWRVPAAQQQTPRHLYRNSGSGYIDISDDLEARGMGFSPTFVDYDGDGDADLAFAQDFERTQLFRNDDGTFFDVTTDEIDDENGMGGVFGDYDNDGDLDWFVSSIDGAGDEGWNQTGNRLYRNNGAGVFTDWAEAAGVTAGGWGWGACFGDLDNDGWLDLVMVGGHSGPGIPERFGPHQTRLWHNNGDGTFTDIAGGLDLRDDQEGRGVLCQDFDRDGDLDVFTANAMGHSTLFRNDGGGGHFLEVMAPIGTRLEVDTGELTQLREIAGGGTFQSWTPPETHFGLGAATVIDELRIRWPDGTTEVRADVEVDQLLVLQGP